MAAIFRMLRHLSSAGPYVATLLIALAAALVFVPGLTGKPVYDDVVVLMRDGGVLNWDMKSILMAPYSREHETYWRPITKFVMAVAWAAGGVSGVHMASLIFHVLTGVFVAETIRALAPRKSPIPLLGALFVCHPAHVESVSWCSALSDPVSGALVIASMWRALAWAGTSSRVPVTPAILALAAMLAKEGGIISCAMLTLVPWIMHGKIDAARARTIVVAALFTLVTYVGLRCALFAGPMASVWESFPDDAAKYLARVVSVGGGLTSVVLWPVGLSPFRESESAFSLLRGAAIIVGVVCAGWYWRRAQVWARPAARLGLGLILMPIVLATCLHPSLGRYPIADRLLYLPIAGAVMVLSEIVRGAKWSVLACACVCGLFVVVSRDQVVNWQDQRSLVLHGLRHNPSDPWLHVMWGDVLLGDLQSGDFSVLGKAKGSYERAVELAGGANPRLDWHNKAIVDGYIGLGWCGVFDRDRGTPLSLGSIAAMFNMALAANSRSAAAWVGLGVTQEMAGNLQQAERSFLVAIGHEETCAEAYYYLGSMKKRLGATNEAVRFLTRALVLRPELTEARRLLEEIQSR